MRLALILIEDIDDDDDEEEEAEEEEEEAVEAEEEEAAAAATAAAAAPAPTMAAAPAAAAVATRGWGCPWGVAAPRLSSLSGSEVESLARRLREMRVALSECASPSRALRGSSTHGRSLAVVRIQARCRGLLVRARLRLRRHALKSAAAVRIQRHWRGHAERNSLNAALRKVDAAFESAQLAACGPELASSSTMLASPHPLGFGIPLPEGHSGQWHARSG